ncbi:hypothetical protein FWP29_24620 [Vibrio parahaemolyticus]|nr:hypothetical protein [Vibrio parahaemolyticus]EGQ9814170.1 hypothetical protein [Vibrio parahaemolyticus]EGQ9888984.1 hypothetical protein [Vibrio parahaemolyticus]EGR0045883.1 hypothetical protein [Vibrio parahaemolyticus]EGR1284036.1 hypothetical protein [Vibrio parahaemolyticus]
MFMAQCFRFGWRRCSPLNWALCRSLLKTLMSSTEIGCVILFICFFVQVVLLSYSFCIHGMYMNCNVIDRLKGKYV